MKFENYLKEAEKRKTDYETFAKETSEWHNEMKGVRVWRATNKNITGFTEIMPRENRNPKDTPKEVHDWFDMIFKKKYGWKARSKGVFAATTPEGLTHFGRNTYLMFPCNGYKYLWSKKIEDLTDYASKVYSLIDYNGMSGDWFTAWGWEDETQKAHMAKDIITSYTDKNLPDASYYNTEVMFYCPNGYYLLGHETFKKYAYDIQEVHL